MSTNISTNATSTLQKVLTGLLSELVSRPTVSHDTEANAAALDWIEEQLAASGLKITRYNQNGHPSLIALSRGNTNPKHPRLWLAGHLDVVPAEPEQFIPKIKGNRLYGRGAFDMKYGLAVYIALMHEMKDKLAGYDLGIMITSDEEPGGFDGAKWLVDGLGYRGDAVLLPECGTSWTLESGAKGKCEWKLISQGRASHGSRPWEGVNAIDQLNLFIGDIKSHVPTEPCGRPQHDHPTVNIGRLNGGAVFNQVADSAEAMLDIRLTPEVSMETAKSWFKAAEAKIPGVKAHLIQGNAAYSNVMEGPASLFRGIAEEITHRPLIQAVSFGASDGRFFAPHGIPVISVPATGGGQHGNEEWVDLKNLGVYYKIIRRFVAEWSKVPE